MNKYKVLHETFIEIVHKFIKYLTYLALSRKIKNLSKCT